MHPSNGLQLVLVVQPMNRPSADMSSGVRYPEKAAPSDGSEVMPPVVLSQTFTVGPLRSPRSCRR